MPGGMPTTGESLLFSFEGLVLASLIYSLPFAVQPLQTAFGSVSNNLLEAATTLGASFPDRFLRIVLPLSRRGYLTAAVLTFAHTVGEFGIVLMIGGNIPGETRVASIALYESVETLEYGSAHQMALALLGFSFLVLLLVFLSNRSVGTKKRGWTLMVSLTVSIKLARDYFRLAIDETVPLAGTLGILGPSGAGKTTLLRLLAGLGLP